MPSVEAMVAASSRKDWQTAAGPQRHGLTTDAGRGTAAALVRVPNLWEQGDTEVGSHLGANHFERRQLAQLQA